MHPVGTVAAGQLVGVLSDSDPVLDQALARIGELACRLHAVRDLHRPRRTLLGGCVCSACRERYPCPTADASRR